MQNFQVVVAQLVCDGDASDGLQGNTVMNRPNKNSFRRLMNSQNIRRSRNFQEPFDIIFCGRDSERLLRIRCGCSFRLKKEKRPFVMHRRNFDLVIDYWPLVSQMRELK